MSEPVLSDGCVEVGFDAVTGGLVRLVDRVAAHENEGGAVQGGTPSLFVLEVPRGGDRTVVAATEVQTLSRVVQASDRRGLTLEWDELVASNGERLPVAVTATATLDGAGRLELALELRTGGIEVEAVRFPVLRGIGVPAGERLDLVRADYTQGQRVALLPAFDSNAPYWGTTYPEHASGNLRPEVVANPTAPFVVLAGGTAGLSVLPSTPTDEFIGWRTSLEPGYHDSLTRLALDPDGGHVVTFEAVQVPVQHGGRLRPVPITVAPYRGDWEQGLAPYLATQRPGRVPSAAWLREPRTWLQVQLMSTENEARYDFAELTGIVEDCAAAGIGAIQIVGWNEGGQDGLVPVHRPAQRLGGEAGLRDVLDRARELDVKAVLYVKYQWVEHPGPYWDELAADVCRDANGQPYVQPGPVYHTSRKRYGMSTPWYVPLCFSSAALRARFAGEVAELARWGAAGVLADESLYHGRALLCFAAEHEHSPGASAYLWDGAFVQDLRAAAEAVDPEFVIAGEGCFDGQFEHYDLSYFRSASERHVPLGRQLRPDARMLTALTGFDDRNMAHQCLLHGYGMSLEPFHFKGRPQDAPRSVAHAAAVDALRSRLAPWLWTGCYRGAADVTAVPEDPAARPAQIAVWEHAERPGSRVVVVAHYDDEPRVYGLDMPGFAEPMVLHPEGPADPAPLVGGRLELPARGAAVLLDAGEV